MKNRVKESDRLVSQELKGEDLDFDVALRPARIQEFVGQAKLKENLRIFIEAARRRKEPLDHILLFGPPGLGKTSLAYIIAREMNTNIRSTSGPVLARPGDLAGILTNLEEGEVLFVDEIHRLPPVVEEYLYPAMEGFVIDIMIDKGPSARSVKINLPRFTLIGATTRSGLLTSPLRSRFGIAERINYYAEEELAQVIQRSSKILKVEVEESGAFEIARRSRGTPRVANRLLRRVRDFVQVKRDGRITREAALQALQMLEVDDAGLDPMDKRILDFILREAGGGPAGINTLAVGVGEEADTLEEIYEPYLIQKGFLKRTPSGRMATQKAYEHLGLPLPARAKQAELL